MTNQIVHTQAIETAIGTMVITADDAAAAIDTISKSQAANTTRSHESRLAVFRGWLSSRGMHLMDAVPVPVPVVVMYLNDRWNAGKKLNTIDADLAAIGWWHAEQRMESPSRDKAVRDTMRGLRRKTSEAIKSGDVHLAQSGADAAIGTIMIRMIRTIDLQAANETIRLRDRAMLLLGFAMGARRSEIAGLHTGHIEWRPQGIIVNVWAGKTGDRQAEIMPGDDAVLCPITALRAWMDHANITDGPLFRQITITPRGERRAVVSDDGISGQVVNRTFARWADAAGLPAGKWTAHSMRAGFVVQGEMAGIAESQLRAQTGHKSSAYFVYAQKAQALTTRRNVSLRG